ncbi:hypothetical protein KM043_009847 [Ampulex compressa]|nr:hypothetical protein KM043_009847 [Ampulex compressa]
MLLGVSGADAPDLGSTRKPGPKAKLPVPVPRSLASRGQRAIAVPSSAEEGLILCSSYHPSPSCAPCTLQYERYSSRTHVHLDEFVDGYWTQRVGVHMVEFVDEYADGYIDKCEDEFLDEHVAMEALSGSPQFDAIFDVAIFHDGTWQRQKISQGIRLCGLAFGDEVFVMQESRTRT